MQEIKPKIHDPLLKVEVLASTLYPQTTAWFAMHQCYYHGMVAEEADEKRIGTEKEYGERLIKHLLEGGRGHYSPLEHPTITFNVGYYPHDVMQQYTRHRIGIAFSVQSFRYTSKQILRIGNTSTNTERDELLEKTFYFRPVGRYNDRDGKKYDYTWCMRETDKKQIEFIVERYCDLIDKGLSEEHARAVIPYNVRQHFVMSVNARSLMHLLDMRAKKDAQLEAQQLAYQLFTRFKRWMPEIAGWYATKRYERGMLAP